VGASVLLASIFLLLLQVTMLIVTNFSKQQRQTEGERGKIFPQVIKEEGKKMEHLNNSLLLILIKLDAISDHL